MRVVFMAEPANATMGQGSLMNVQQVIMYPHWTSHRDGTFQGLWRRHLHAQHMEQQGDEKQAVMLTCHIGRAYAI